MSTEDVRHTQFARDVVNADHAIDFGVKLIHHYFLLRQRNADMTSCLRTFAIAVALLLARPVMGEDATNLANAAPAGEWPAYVEPLLPPGDRRAAKMSADDDPRLRAELYKPIYSQISSGYLARLYADPKHPDFWPTFNTAYNIFGPNPDNSYYLTPIESNGSYKISRYRGTTRIVDFSVAGGSLLPYGHSPFCPVYGNYDFDKRKMRKDSWFEVILSNERLAGYKDKCWRLDPQATYILVRHAFRRLVA